MLRVNNLIGFGPAGDVRPTELSYITRNSFYATSGTSTIQIPSLAKVGDLAIISNYISGLDDGMPATVTPSGWTLIKTDSQTFVNVYQKTNTYFKVLSESDLNTTVTGMALTGYDVSMMCAIFRAPLKMTSAAIQGTPSGSMIYNSTNTINQTIAAGTSPSIVIGIASSDSEVAITTGGVDIPGGFTGMDLNYALNESSSPSNSYAGTPYPGFSFTGSHQSFRIGYTT